MKDRARIVALLREAVMVTQSASIVIGLSRVADDIERRELDLTVAYRRLDYALARTRSPAVLAAATAALEFLGSQRGKP